jgi:N-acetyl-gamma-glutamyl-phosphate reductase
MKTKVFINGSEGTTGLRIHERISVRDDIELLTIDPEKRKDPAERSRLINASDITFLCLPDAAAVESAALATNENVVVIDASTAHRTAEGWAYGFAELSKGHREAIKNGKRIAVPGCHATGFIALVYPMIAGGLMPSDYPVSAFSLTGYSGGGKKMIAAYEDADKKKDLFAPREYALSQQHKHLKEMKAIPGLATEPIFIPVVDDYYCGMIVNLPLHKSLMKIRLTPEELRDRLADYYNGQRFIRVANYGAEEEYNGYLSANEMAGLDSAQIFVTGNDDRIVVSAMFDNLGKGASGAAVECLNISMGIDPATGLVL